MLENDPNRQINPLTAAIWLTSWREVEPKLL